MAAAHIYSVRQRKVTVLVNEDLATALLTELRHLRGAIERLEQRLPPLTPAQRAARARERRKTIAKESHAVSEAGVTQSPEGRVTHGEAVESHRIDQLNG